MPVLEQFKYFIRHGKAAKDGQQGSAQHSSEDHTQQQQQQPSSSSSRTSTGAGGLPASTSASSSIGPAAAGGISASTSSNSNSNSASASHAAQAKTTTDSAQAQLYQPHGSASTSSSASKQQQQHITSDPNALLHSSNTSSNTSTSRQAPAAATMASSAAMAPPPPRQSPGLTATSAAAAVTAAASSAGTHLQNNGHHNGANLDGTKGAPTAATTSANPATGTASATGPGGAAASSTTAASAAAAALVEEERKLSLQMPVYEGLSERFTLLCKMGDGAFSNVYKARDRQTGQKVAIKVVRKYELNSNQVSSRPGSSTSFSFPLPCLCSFALFSRFSCFAFRLFGLERRIQTRGWVVGGRGWRRATAREKRGAWDEATVWAEKGRERNGTCEGQRDEWQASRGTRHGMVWYGTRTG